MFLVSYEDDNGNIKNIAGASSLMVAKRFIERQMAERGGSPIEDFEWVTGDNDKTLFVLGGTQYIIEPLIDVT